MFVVFEKYGNEGYEPVEMYDDFNEAEGGLQELIEDYFEGGEDTDNYKFTICEMEVGCRGVMNQWFYDGKGRPTVSENYYF